MSENIRKFRYNGKDTLSLPAERTAFETLKDWLASIMQELCVDDKFRKKLMISADEIFTNIADYGYPKGDGKTKVAAEFDIDEKTFILIFTDTGIAYNPLEGKIPNASATLEESQIGGLGLFIVKKFMDSIEYKRENDCNVLILKKCVESK